MWSTAARGWWPTPPDDREVLGCIPQGALGRLTDRGAGIIFYGGKFLAESIFKGYKYF